LEKECTRFEEDTVVLADLDNLGPAHERVQVDLVDRWEEDALVDELLKMMSPKVGYLTCLRKASGRNIFGSPQST
jgi:hypothetical protein